MENKIIIGVVSVFVAIVVLAGILMPVIDMATEPKQETAQKEGAYMPLMYVDEPQDTTSYTYFSSFMSVSNEFTIRKGPLGSYVDQIVNLSDIADKTSIIYSDTNVTVYIEDDNYHFDFVDESLSEDKILPLTSENKRIMRVSAGIKYDLGAGYQVTSPTLPEYYYVYDVNGDYANFAGDNPPTMDTPAVSVTGAYIGERYGTIDVDPFGANLYKLMPFLVIIAILVSAVVYFIGKSYL